MYIPKPMNTQHIILDEELLKIAETLAKNTHENWAAKRLKDGWSFGPERNDRLKQHPNLVPYEELPEIEKDFDRITSMETLKVIKLLGYELRE